MSRAVWAAVALLGVGLIMAACAPGYTAGSDQWTNYLRRAQMAAQSRDAGATLAALDGAENAWLIADSARGNPCMYYERPELRAIGNARVSVQQARWPDADQYIREAIAHIGVSG